MFTPPEGIMRVLRYFAPVFSERIWDWVQVLVLGAILAPRQRVVTAALRVMGLGQTKHFQNYHRVLNRARWSGLEVSRILLGLLVAAFVPPDRPIVVVGDETLERRRGPKIKDKGYFRDPVLSSQTRGVASEGLRWLSMMVLVTVPWSQRKWALPFLTVLARHKKTDDAQGRRHKTLIDWVGQMIGQTRRWLPQRSLVLVVDGGLMAIKLGLKCRQFNQPVTLVSRLRLDARLFDPPSPKKSSGRPARVGKRQPSLVQRLADSHTPWQPMRVTWYGGKQRPIEYVTGIACWYNNANGCDPLLLRWILVRDPLGKFDAQGFLCTDETVPVLQVLDWYVQRWNVEVTFEEVRAHLGFETQRQWSDLAIARTSPAILGLFSFVTLVAHDLTSGQTIPIRTTAWYSKHHATFSDVLVYVRHYIWHAGELSQSHLNYRHADIPPHLLYALLDALYYAA